MAEGATPFCARPHLCFSVCRRPQRHGMPSTSKAMNNAKNTTLFPYLERLLEGEAVEWKTLGEVFHTRNGYTPSKANEEFWTDGTIPWFRMEDIRANGRILYDSALHITPQAVKRNGLFKANSIILATSATVGEHALLLQDSLTNQRFTNFEIKDNLKEQLLPKFVFYYFFLIDEWCKQHLVIGNFPSVDVQQLINLPFPLPPLRVQARIVEILDKFTQLEAELEKELAAELEARKKQYAYYRDQLLNFSQCPPLNVNIEWKTLGEVFHTRNGYTPSKSNEDFWKDGTIPWFRMDDIRANGRILYDSALHVTPQAVKRNGLFKVNSILLATTATIGEHALIQQNALANQQLTNFEIKEKYRELLIPKFAFHYFFIIDEWCKANARQNNLPSVDVQKLRKEPFPLPPLSEQRRIVDILDRFDTPTNSISEGLPKEIALRRKQYEYYRDALLNFPRAEVTA